LATSAEFLLSAAAAGQFPPEELPEVAFLGRSNAGKSTLLNCLAGQKGLAFTSSTPGRTQAVNFFLVDGRMMFVDLPGYGYAKAPKEVSREWQKVIEAYLRERRRLALGVLLVDSRRGWMESDLELKNWLDFHGRPYVVVATKVDKLNQKQRSQSQRAIRAHYPEGELIWFSAVSGQGVRELWQTIWKTTAR
jgi:GTP-binding protein